LRELADEENANVSPRQKSFLEKLRDYFVPLVKDDADAKPDESRSRKSKERKAD